jgi:hypothetical protein
MKIKCCFDVTNEYIKKNIPCIIDVVDDNDVKYTYINKTRVNEMEYNNDFQVCSGYLKDDDTPIPNANIFFLYNNKEKNTEVVNDGVNGIKNAERNNTFEKSDNCVIVEKCKTDENGKYTAFIENGIYDIKIDCGKYKDVQKNIYVKDGIQGERYCLMNSLINKPIGKSTLIMNKSNSKLIKLSLLDEHNKYTNGDLIISQNNKIIVYIKINKKSMFMLDNGIYDIRLRNKYTDIKIINNFEFNENDDFVEKLIQNL